MKVHGPGLSESSRSRVKDLGFRVLSSGLRLFGGWELGIEDWGVGCRVHRVGCRLHRVEGLGCGDRVVWRSIRVRTLKQDPRA